MDTLKTVAGVLDKVDTTRRLLTTDRSRPPDQWDDSPYRPKADCPECHGAGFVYPLNQWGEPIYSRAVVCRAKGCYADSAAAYLRGEQYGQSRGIRPAPQSFENFLIVPGARAAFDAAKAFCSPTASFLWLLIYGPCGNGKSHLCNAVARKLQERGVGFRYTKAADIHAEIRRAVQSDAGKDSVLDEYKSVLVLIIDDYGVESCTDAQAANMEDILVTRHERLLPTMMTTNLTWSQLPERIRSRFDDRQMSIRIENSAPDYRSRK